MKSPTMIYRYITHSFCFLLSFVGAVTAYSQSFSWKGFECKPLHDHTAQIDDYCVQNGDALENGVLAIPSKVNNGNEELKVTIVGGGAPFSVNAQVKRLEIPSTVKKLGANVFTALPLLTTVRIHDGMSEVGAWAFALNPSLTQVTWGEQLNAVADNAFYQCTRLSNIPLQNIQTVGEAAFQNTALTAADLKSVRTVGDFAFSECRCLTTVNLSRKLEGVGAFAFAHCSALTELTMVAGKVGESAFLGCTSLRKVSFGDNVSSVTALGKAAFYGCGALAEVRLPDTMEVIEPMTFLECSSLKEIKLPENLKEIGEEAFRGTAIDRVVLPEGVVSVGDMAFADCPNLKEIVVGCQPVRWGNGAVAQSVTITKRK